MTEADPGAPNETQFPFNPGANVLVASEADGEALPFALSKLNDVDERVLISTDVTAERITPMAAEEDAESPLTVLDCTGEPEPVPNITTPIETTVTVADPDIPSVGEAAIAALDRLAPSATAGICLDSVSTLVARSTVQQTYKLLYVLARRVRQGDHVGIYTWDTPVELRTLRILGQALEYQVSLTWPEGATVQTMTEVGDDR